MLKELNKDMIHLKQTVIKNINNLSLVNFPNLLLVWAFGLLIYEILHNFPPRIPLEQIINGAKPSFSKDREFPTLFKIFDICLTFQPEHRPTTSVLLKILEN